MEKIIRGRGEGKTTELIKRSYMTEYPILVRDIRHRNDLVRMAKDLGYENIPKPIVIQDIMNGFMRGELRFTSTRGEIIRDNILVDEADLLLQDLLYGYDYKIDTITISIDDEEDEHAKLRKAAQPLVDYLRANYDPHTSVIVENDFVNVVRDEMGVPFEIK